MVAAIVPITMAQQLAMRTDVVIEATAKKLIEVADTTSVEVVDTAVVVLNSSFCVKFLPFSVKLPCHTEKSISYSFHSPLSPF